MPKQTPHNKVKKEIEEELGCKIKEIPTNDPIGDKYSHIETGVDTIKALLKVIKKPADKNSLKEIKESLKLLGKKVKLMKTNEALQAQYLDRTMYDVVNGVFQAFHLYVISTDGVDDDVLVFNTLEWLRTHETAYEIAARVQAAAEARADFVNGKK